VRELLNSSRAPRLIDVRTPAEFETAHIPGAYKVPLDLLREHRDEIVKHLDRDVDALRKAFGWFVLVMSSVILAEELHLWVGVAAAALTAVAGAIYFACNRTAYCPVRRLIRQHATPAAA
jgi:tRNA 2-selenouridine synthase SelU